MVAGTASDPVSACGGFGRSQDQVLRQMAEKGQEQDLLLNLHDVSPHDAVQQPWHGRVSFTLQQFLLVSPAEKIMEDVYEPCKSKTIKISPSLGIVDYKSLLK